MRMLHILIAALGTAKKRVHSEQTSLHRVASKASAYQGLTKTYEPLLDGDSFRPSGETKNVSLVADKVLDRYSSIVTEEWDLELSVRCGNQQAKADVIIDDDVVLVKDAPTAWLLYMEKQLDELRTFVSKMPVLDPAVDWQQDPHNKDVLRAPPVKAAQNRKRQEPIVLYDATEKHPAQTQLITRDVIIGWWTQVAFASALSPDRKSELLDRIDKLASAVKAARIQANAVEVPHRKVGDNIFEFLFQ